MSASTFFTKTIATTLLIGAFALPASASIQTEVVNKPVQYTELELSSTTGQTALYKRLRSAAKNVCSINHRYSKSLADARDGRACFKEALTSAVEELAHPGLTNLHKSS